MTTRTVRSAFLFGALVAGCRQAPVTATAPASGPIASLRSTIDSMANGPAFRNAHWGILVVDPQRGDTLYSRNAGKLFIPASNQKLLTGSVALAQLGPDFRFRTTFVARGPVRDGTLAGDLAIVGRGDPTLSDAMRGDANTAMLAIADSLIAHGVRRITGRVVSGFDAFPDAQWGYGWDWDDLDYEYGAGVDELFFNEGFSTIIVRAGARPGDPATLALRPGRRYPTLKSSITTVAAGSLGTARSRIQWFSDNSPTEYRLTGSIVAGDSAEVTVAHRDPSAAYLSALAEALQAKGIDVRGALPVQERNTSMPAAGDTLFATLSAPLSDVLKRLEKPSQNQIAEILFRTLGLEKTGVGSADSGRRVVERQLVAWGADSAGFAVRDGSGLSRHDYVSPETIVHVLDAMRRSTNFRVFYDALPIAGVDGTIRNRMRDTPAQNNVHAKTGTVDKVRSLSGYVTTADGRLLLFSVLANNFTVRTADVDRVADSIAARLASLRLGGAAQ